MKKILRSISEKSLEYKADLKKTLPFLGYAGLSISLNSTHKPYSCASHSPKAWMP